MLDPQHYCKLSPLFPHQRECLIESADLPVYALFHEQRTGKTGIIYATACYQYAQGVIDTLVVVSWPNGVQINWIVDDAPMYIPDRIPWSGIAWETSNAARKWFRSDLLDLVKFKGLSIISITAESVSTLAVRKFLKYLFDHRKGVILVADESSFMESPDSVRTQTMQRIRRHPAVKFARILEGTPSGNKGPLGLYSPFLFLDWKIFGFTQYILFKTHYAVWEKQDFRRWQDKERDPNGGVRALVQKRDKNGQPIYKNMDELQRRLAPVSSRVTRAEVFPHLKAPIYQSIYIELTNEQRRVYDELRETYRAELHNHDVITANIVLTRYLRLQQIASNYYPEHENLLLHEPCGGEGCALCDDMGFVIGTVPAVKIDTAHNPRLERLIYEIKRLDNPVLIGARFRQDAADIVDACRGAGVSIARYDGTQAARIAAKADFQEGRVQCFVGNQSGLARGHKLTAARTIMIYSQDWSLRTRLQFQDRPVLHDMPHALEILDFIARDTVDEKIVTSLRANKNLADSITGDPHGDWL